MATSVSYAELLKMSAKDLQSEIRENELNTQKMRLGITMGRDKDTARYQRARRELARMKTALTIKSREQALKEPKKASTLRPPGPHPGASAALSLRGEGKKAPAKATSRKASSSKS